MSAPDFLAVGRIGRAHGIRGEVQVDVLTDFPDDTFVPGRTLYVGADGQPDPLPSVVTTVRAHRARLLVGFEGIATRTQAEMLTGQFAQIPAAEAHDLPEGDYFAYQVVGLSAVTTEGTPVGRVIEVLETGANDVLRIAGEREILVPFIDDVIADIDLEAGRLTIHPLPGLLEGDATA